MRHRIWQSDGCGQCSNVLPSPRRVALVRRQFLSIPWLPYISLGAARNLPNFAFNIHTTFYFLYPPLFSNLFLFHDPSWLPP